MNLIRRTMDARLATTRLRAGWAICLAALVACAPADAGAQMYRVDEPLDPGARLHQPAAVRYTRNPDGSPEDRQKYLDYFTKYFFQAMTRTDPASLAELSGARDILFKQTLWATGNRQIQAELTKIAQPELSKIVHSAAGQPPYHPTVRYNAVLMLGLLDEVYDPQGNTDKPYLRATGDLFKVVDSATANNNYPPAVILGALIGLERHAQLRASLDPRAIDLITNATLKLVLQDQPIQSMNPEAYDWLRLRAAGVLAQLGSVGTDNQVFNAILGLVGKLKSLDDRCEAAALLAKLSYDGAKLDATVTAERLLKLTADIGEAELARAIQFEGGPSTTTTFSPGRDGGRGEPDFGSVSTGTQGKYPRQPLLVHLDALRKALTATRPALPPETQAKFDAVVSAVNPVIDAAGNRDTIELGIATRVREMAAALKRLTAASAAPAAAAGQ